MKKVILLTGCLLFLASGLSAQSGFDLGVSGTFSSTWLYKQNNYGTLAAFQNATVQKSRMNYSATWGGNGGFCLGYMGPKHWGFQAEVQYQVGGQKYNDNFEGPATIPQGTFGGINSYVNVQRVLKLDYIQIPLMAKFETGKKNIKFFACIGPQVGIRTYAYEQIKVAGYVYLPDSLDFAINQKFKTYDVGLALQAGIQYNLTSHLYFNFAISAYQSIIDINGPGIEAYYNQHVTLYQQTYNFRGGVMVGIHYLFFRNKGGVLKITKPVEK